MNDGTALRPGGAVEIPGFDPDHETYAKHEDQTVTVTYADESTADVTVKAGSYLRVYRQSDGRQYATTADTPIDLDNCSDDIEELEAPLAAGETLSFDFALLVTGAPENNVGVCVRVPPDPTGGFQVVGQSVLETFQGGMFGADSFNNPAGTVKAGIEGTLEGHSVIRVRGVVGNGPRPGMLRIQLGPAQESVANISWFGRLIASAETFGVDPGDIPHQGDPLFVDAPTFTIAPTRNRYWFAYLWGFSGIEFVEDGGLDWEEIGSGSAGGGSSVLLRANVPGNFSPTDISITGPSDIGITIFQVWASADDESTTLDFTLEDFGTGNEVTLSGADPLFETRLTLVVTGRAYGLTPDYGTPDILDESWATAKVFNPHANEFMGSHTETGVTMDMGGTSSIDVWMFTVEVTLP